MSAFPNRRYFARVAAEPARRRRPGLLQEIEDLARAAGYEVARERPSYAMAHLRLRYVDADARPALLKFDINFLDRVPVLPPQRLELRHHAAVAVARRPRIA
jgi:hypothetical protein